MLSEAFWKGRRVLVTGHAGFKGSWLCAWLARLGADVTGVGLRGGGEEPTLFEVAGLDAAVRERPVDVRDADALREAVTDAAPEIVFHLAAQSLVLRGHRDPLGTLATNVMGTANLLDAVPAVRSVRAVLVATSDKCYRDGDLICDEDSPLGGAEPYGASKACAELVADAYRQIRLAPLGVGLATMRAGNVIGGGDAAEDRLIPDLVRAYVDERLAVLRRPEGVRPWQHVLDALAGYLLLAERLWQDPDGFAGPWNFGPDLRGSTTAGELAAAFAAALGGPRLEVAAGPTPHEAATLRLSAAQARRRLGWIPRLSLDETVRWTAQGYARLIGDGGTDWLAQQIDRYAARLAEAAPPVPAEAGRAYA
jgi:CDP-glucose 4,6-dehydratase